MPTPIILFIILFSSILSNILGIESLITWSQVKSHSSYINLSELSSNSVIFDFNSDNGVLADYHMRNVSISYQLNLPLLLHYTINQSDFNRTTSCPSPEHLNIVNGLEDNLKICRLRHKLLGNFLSYKNQGNNSLDKHCDETTLNQSILGQNKDVIINDLLPHQIYNFNIIVIGKTDVAKNWEKLEDTSVSVCMRDDKPLYPPQTSVGCFSIAPPPPDTKLNSSRIVILYWRPLPRVLYPSDDFFYDIESINLLNGKINFTERINGTLDKYTGKMKLELPYRNNITHHFQLRSRNTIGASEFSSIIIPIEDKIIDLDGRLNLYVTEVENNIYSLMWNRVTSFTNKKGKLLISGTSNSGSQAIYTIYWCPMSSVDHSCTFIEGMSSTNKTEFILDARGTEFERRNFAISVQTPDRKYYSGMIWTECVANTQAVEKPPKLSAISVANNHTAIYTSWEMGSCNSVMSVITHFEINYCKYADADICSNPVVSKSESENKWADFNFEDDLHECNARTMDNNLQSGIFVSNLNASSIYVLRMRNIVKSGKDTTFFPWSNTISAQTFPGPKEMENCTFRRHMTTVMIFILLSVMLGILMWTYQPARKTCAHYWKLVSMYHNAKPDLPAQLYQQTLDEEAKGEIKEMDGKDGFEWGTFWFNEDTVSISDASFTDEPR